MGFPCEFTIPVPGPWQERHSSAANRAGDLVDRARVTIIKAYKKTHGCQVFAWGIKPCGHARRCGFTLGLFAGSDWGKMRMFMTN